MMASVPLVAGKQCHLVSLSVIIVYCNVNCAWQSYVAGDCMCMYCRNLRCNKLYKSIVCHSVQEGQFHVVQSIFGISCTYINSLCFIIRLTYISDICRKLFCITSSYWLHESLSLHRFLVRTIVKKDVTQTKCHKMLTVLDNN